MSLRANRKIKNTEEKAQKSGFKKGKFPYVEPINSQVHKILFLQQTIGNQAVQRLFNSGQIQAKMKIGQSSDIYEQEADRVAEQIVRMPEDTNISHKESAIRKKNESFQTVST